MAKRLLKVTLGTWEKVDVAGGGPVVAWLRGACGLTFVREGKVGRIRR